MDNVQRFERIEHSLKATEANVARIIAALEKQPVGTPGSHSGLTIGNGTPQGNPIRQPFQVRSIKLDFPRFDGKNVVGWIFKAQQFFDYYNTPDAERLIIASVHLDHEIVPWFQMMQRVNPFQSWTQFTRALELDFGPSLYDSPRENLFKLKQTGTVAEYYMEFTSLANRSEGLTNEALIDCFVSGLHEDIKRDVKAMTPHTILRAVSLAKLFEEKVSNITQTKTYKHIQ